MFALCYWVLYTDAPNVVVCCCLILSTGSCTQKEMNTAETRYEVVKDKIGDLERQLEVIPCASLCFKPCATLCSKPRSISCDTVGVTAVGVFIRYLEMLLASVAALHVP